MRFFLRYVLPFLIALPIGFLLLYPQVFRCMRISQSPDFTSLKPLHNVYVNHNATSRQRQQLRNHIVTAQNRIQRFWGDRRGQAILIYCPHQDEYEQYCIGGEGAGCSVGTPWGASYLVLGPDGNNADVIAHELCHDELFSRLGWWRVKREIPVWFNEGLALMLDYRFTKPLVEQSDTASQPDSVFTEEADLVPFTNQPMLKLAELETTRDFFGGNYDQVMLAYQTAADEVSRWLAVVGWPSVSVLTNAIANGDDFADIYLRLERAKRNQRHRP
ncbi:hypothetical protein GCM10027341_51460 [Spirosoma knui]